MDRRGIIVPTENSKAVVFPVSPKNVKIEGFFKKYLEKNRKISIPFLYKQFQRYGTVDNFKIVAGIKKGEITRRLATDSDFYKHLEAISWDLQNEYDKDKEKILDKSISLISKAQEKSGYIDTYYTGNYRKLRFKELKKSHELYCGGHLIQSAIAHYRSTGKENFLSVAIKWADYIYRKYEKREIKENDGHPEVEMALVELYRTTGEKKYLHLSRILMAFPYSYLNNLPFLKFNEVVGHAVRMMYLCCGATDYYIETGERKYFKVLEKLWEDLSERKVYITGGIGSRYEGESFGLPYELPNLRAYCESCAAISLMMWNYRMFCATGDAKYMDLFETTLYNGFLSGYGFDGKSYFYVNPLASRGQHQRKEWYDCTCCPPNIQRMISSLPGYFYCVSKEGIWINLYENSSAEIPLLSGTHVKIYQKTDYPWKGKVEIKIEADRDEDFYIFLRIPFWSKETEIKYNGKIFNPESGKYFKVKIKRRGKVSVDFNIKVEFYISNMEVESCRKCLAIKRGPLVYCLESIDNPEINLFNSIVWIQKLKEMYEKNFDGFISLKGKMLTSNEKTPIYQPKEEAKIGYKIKTFKAIPYFLWANRENSQMNIWFPEK